MSSKNSLIDKNIPFIILFIIWCLTIYVLFLSSPVDFLNKSKSIFNQLTAKDGVIIALSPIVALVLTGIISSGNKARLVFFRWHFALPGHRAFSDLVKKDPRIDMVKLTKKIGKLPRKPLDQNSRWYSIYKRYSDSVIVKQAHKNFLLTRDVCAISFLFAIIGSIGIYFGKQDLKLMLGYFFIMAAHYFILAITAQNYGNRFVCNVLAEYVTEEN